MEKAQVIKPILCIYIQGVRKRLYLFKKFVCLLGAILKILCPRERRVFQSKLGVSSINQCNLHHSPHTGKKKKKIKSTIFFGHLYIYSSECNVCDRTLVSLTA
jgi:hypothetical protein